MDPIGIAIITVLVIAGIAVLIQAPLFVGVLFGAFIAMCILILWDDVFGSYDGPPDINS